MPTVTQLIGGRARTKTQACLTPKADQLPQQGSEPRAQVNILVFMLQVKGPMLAYRPAFLGLSAGERRLFQLLTEGLMEVSPTLGRGALGLLSLISRV